MWATDCNGCHPDEVYHLAGCTLAGKLRGTLWLRETDTMPTDNEINAAAQRLLHECEFHEAEYGIEDSLLSFAQDIKTVAEYALGASEDGKRLRAAIRQARSLLPMWQCSVAIERSKRILDAALAPPTVAPHDGAKGA